MPCSQEKQNCHPKGQQFLEHVSSFFVVFVPVVMERAVFIDALERVGTEVVAQGLNEVGADAFAAVRIQVCQGVRKGHRFAKSFLERCNDIAFLADLMGHESIETTRIYLRKTSTEQRAIVDEVIDW